MISCLSSSCRQRQALRAALITLVAFTGCQGSMRTWRRDDPNLHDLIVTPHPWDEPATKHESSPGTGSTKSGRGAKAKVGRANPYAYQGTATERRHFESTDDVAEVGGDEEPNFAVEDAEFKSVISQADPKHRAMLVQMYQAVQARRQALDTIAPDDADVDDDSYDEDSEAQEPSAAKGDAQALAKNRRPVDDNVRPAHYSLSDKIISDKAMSDYSLPEQGEPAVRQASATRSLDTDQLGNRIPANKMSKERDEPVHYSMSDDAEDALPQPRSNAKTSNSKNQATQNPIAKPTIRPQEVKPPSKSRTDKRSVREPVSDTGYEEPISGLPVRGPREDATTISSRKHASGYDQADGVDTHYTDRSYVAQASAESSTSVQASTKSHAADNTGLPPHQADGVVNTDWRELADQMLRALEVETVDSSANAQLNHHVTKRILFVLLGQLEQALEPIPGLQPHEQEYFRHNFQALYNSIDPRGNPVLSRRWPLVMEDHRIAMSHLGAVSNLEVKNAAFCSHVDGFGSITKIPTIQFRPNQELLLYCEVENFVSEQKKDGYETKLRGNYEIVDANQTRIADFILPEEVDMCKNPRRDYFFVYRIYMPQNIAPGRYQLRLTIEDMKGNKFGQTSLDMQISG